MNVGSKPKGLYMRQRSPSPKRCLAVVMRRNKRVTLDENHLRIRLSEGHPPFFRTATSTPLRGNDALVDPEAYCWGMTSPRHPCVPDLSRLRDYTEFFRTHLLHSLHVAELATRAGSSASNKYGGAQSALRLTYQNFLTAKECVGGRLDIHAMDLILISRARKVLEKSDTQRRDRE